MNIVFATYHSVMLLKGGPKTQILESKKALEALGVRVSLFEMWNEISRSHADLVHLFGANIGTYHFARELHRANIPFVVSPIFFTRHNYSFVNVVTAFDRIVRAATRGFWSDYGLIRDICNWATLVLPNTSDEAALFTEGFGISKDKIRVVPNGVEPRFYHADPSLFREKYGLDNFILNVGHIGPERKNVLRLIRALREIDHPAVIIGRNDGSKEARRCIQEAHENPRIRLIDYLPNDNDMLASAYAACDVFALPSQFETPGIAALEAGLAGAKIVITNYGGTKDYFGSHAEYVEPSSVADIRQGIERALHQRKESYLREYIREHFTWEKIGEELKTVYQGLS